MMPLPTSTNDLRELIFSANRTFNTDLERHQESSNRGMETFLREAFRLQDAETADRQGAVDRMQGEFDKAQAPTISDQDIDRMYTRESDELSKGSMEDMSAIRQGLGGAGVVGGASAAGLAARTRLARLGQLSGKKRDLRIFKAQQDADDAARRWQMGIGLAGLEYGKQSDTALGALGELVGVQLTRESLEMGLQEAQLSADAMVKSAKEAKEGQIIGGALGGIGGILGGIF